MSMRASLLPCFAVAGGIPLSALLNGTWQAMRVCASSETHSTKVFACTWPGQCSGSSNLARRKHLRGGAHLDRSICRRFEQRSAGSQRLWPSNTAARLRSRLLSTDAAQSAPESGLSCSSRMCRSCMRSRHLVNRGPDLCLSIGESRVAQDVPSEGELQYMRAALHGCM